MDILQVQFSSPELSSSERATTSEKEGRSKRKIFVHSALRRRRATKPSEIPVVDSQSPYADEVGPSSSSSLICKIEELLLRRDSSLLSLIWLINSLHSAVQHVAGRLNKGRIMSLFVPSRSSVTRELQHVAGLFVVPPLECKNSLKSTFGRRERENLDE